MSKLISTNIPKAIMTVFSPKKKEILIEILPLGIIMSISLFTIRNKHTKRLFRLPPMSTIIFVAPGPVGNVLSKSRRGSSGGFASAVVQ